MKKIEAIIRKTKFAEVRESLEAAGIEWFAYTNVRGIGKARQERIYRGLVYDTSSIERIMISIVLSDESVKPAVDAIIQSAHTGEIGDGRIFVLPVEEAYRIRIGEDAASAQYVERRGEH